MLTPAGGGIPTQYMSEDAANPDLGKWLFQLCLNSCTPGRGEFAIQ